MVVYACPILDSEELSRHAPWIFPTTCHCHGMLASRGKMRREGGGLNMAERSRGNRQRGNGPKKSSQRFS